MTKEILSNDLALNTSAFLFVHAFGVWLSPDLSLIMTKW